MPGEIFHLPYYSDPANGIEKDLVRLQEKASDFTARGLGTGRLMYVIEDMAQLAYMSREYHRTGVVPTVRWTAARRRRR